MIEKEIQSNVGGMKKMSDEDLREFVKDRYDIEDEEEIENILLYLKDKDNG